jgi:hypothetical protein
MQGTLPSETPSHPWASLSTAPWPMRLSDGREWSSDLCRGGPEEVEKGAWEDRHRKIVEGAEVRVMAVVGKG